MTYIEMVEKAFELRAESENLCRKALLGMLEENGGEINFLDRQEEGFSLNVIGFDFDVINISTVIKEGNSIYVDGLTEDNNEVRLDEGDLCHGDLCLIVDFILNGIK